MDRSTSRHDHSFQRKVDKNGFHGYVCLHCGIMRYVRPTKTETAETPEELRVKMQQARRELEADLADLRG